jgi:hypothetical protein
MLLEQGEEQKCGLMQDAVSSHEYQGTCKAALEAAKEGLRYIAHRDFLGKEHMEEVRSAWRKQGTHRGGKEHMEKARNTERR